MNDSAFPLHANRPRRPWIERRRAAAAKHQRQSKDQISRTHGAIPGVVDLDFGRMDEKRKVIAGRMEFACKEPASDGCEIGLRLGHVDPRARIVAKLHENPTVRFVRKVVRANTLPEQ